MISEVHFSFDICLFFVDNYARVRCFLLVHSLKDLQEFGCTPLYTEIVISRVRAYCCLNSFLITSTLSNLPLKSVSLSHLQKPQSIFNHGIVIVRRILQLNL